MKKGFPWQVFVGVVLSLITVVGCGGSLLDERAEGLEEVADAIEDAGEIADKAKADGDDVKKCS